jgi:CRISPR/Cas system-associated protein Csx1
MRRYVHYLLLLFLFSCGSKGKEMSEVLAFKEMSELATVEYIVTKIVKAEDNGTWYKVGDRKILMSCEASIKAGIDFSAINEDDVTIDGKSISVVLPKAHLISMNIRPEDVRVEFEETGFFRDDFSAAERDALLTQGERQIKNSVEALGVLTAAETNASLFISNYLKTLGYNRINIRFSANPIPQLK